MIKSIAQHMANKISVNASGGPLRVVGDIGVGCCSLNVEVGTAVAVACAGMTPPVMGTIVGTNVGDGMAVGCAEAGRGCAPIDALH